VKWVIGILLSFGGLDKASPNELAILSIPVVVRLEPVTIIDQWAQEEGLIAVNCKRGKRKEKDEMK